MYLWKTLAVNQVNQIQHQMNNLFVPGKEIVNPFSVKDMDAQTRRVKIMLSAFGNIDSDGDVIARGAFA